MENTLTLPDSWSQVSIDQFIELSTCNLNEDYIEIISILSGEDTEIIDKFTNETILKCMNEVKFILDTPADDKYSSMITLDGIDFFLVSFNQLTVSDTIDLRNYQKEYVKNFAKILSKLYRPEVVDKSIDYPQLFQENCKIGDVHGALVFFSHFVTKYIATMQTSFLNQMMNSMTMKN